MGKKVLTKMPMPRGVAARWRKIYKGQTFYFRGAYDEAVKAWEAKKVQLDGQGQPDSDARRKLRGLLAEYEANGNTEAADNVKAVLYLDEDSPGLAEHTQEGLDLLDNWLKGERSPKVKTVGDAVAAFIARQKARVDGNMLSAGHFDIIMRCAEYFRDFVGKTTGLDKINGQMVEDYHTHLLGKMGGGWSPSYAKRYLTVAKHLIRWAWASELIASLPRNLDSRDLAIIESPAKIKTFNDQELTKLLAGASGQTRLYLLLSLNCGFTQKDISDLRQDEVDWKSGKIMRKRSKTAKHEAVPTIEYGLWPETFALLKEYRSRDPVRVLLNQDGKPLKTECIRPDGRYAKSDNIRCTYSRLCRKLGIKHPKPFKVFRKTSPARLENSEYASCARWFLGHSPRSIADKHYIPPPQDLFDKAIQWLGRQYGIVK